MVLIYQKLNQAQPKELSTYDLLWELWERHYAVLIPVIVYLLALQIYVTWKVLKWFFRGARKYVEVVQHDTATVVGAVAPVYVPERAMPGSEWFRHTRPAHQVELRAELTPGEWTLVGQGFRLRDFLVTANHVVEGHAKLRIRADDNYVDVETSHFRQPAETGSDLAVMLLSTVQWSTLQVRQAKIPKLAVSNSTSAFVYHDGLATTGLVSPHRSAPYVVYSGTTRSGCSGAPLGTSTVVYAMVLGAADVNLALDANWIQAMAYQSESTEDILYREIENTARRTGGKVNYKMFNPGEAVVLSRGAYHVLDIEQIPAHIRDLLEYDDGNDRYVKYSAVPSNRSYPESSPRIDLELPSTSAAARMTYDDNASFLDLHSPAVNAGAKLLKTDLNVPSPNTVEVLPPSDSPPLQVGMNGQQQILAQLKEVLNTISKSPDERLRNQLASNAGQQSSIRRRLLNV